MEVLKINEWLEKDQKKLTAKLLDQLSKLLKDTQIQASARRPYIPFDIKNIGLK